MRASVPSLSVSIQTLSGLVARPPSESAIPIGTVAVILLVLRSTRERLWSPQFGTQRLSKPIASPEQGAWPTVMVSTTLLDFGSIRTTLFLGLFEIQTESPTTIQSGAPGTSNSASGLRAAIGIFVSCVLTPGLP